MRILITNDDGINAPGLVVLQAIANEIAGPNGEVWTVAPAFEQSGVGHCISYTRPMMIAKLGERRFAAEGSPADCVLAGLYDVMPERPDLVLMDLFKQVGVLTHLGQIDRVIEPCVPLKIRFFPMQDIS